MGTPAGVKITVLLDTSFDTVGYGRANGLHSYFISSKIVFTEKHGKIKGKEGNR
jgi:hypothetical protein